MKFGAKAEWLAELKKQGQRVPAIQNRPSIEPWFFYWRAFGELTTTRSWGESPGPIPWTAIQKWAEVHGLSGLRFRQFVEVITALDNEYLTQFFNRKKDEALKRGRSTTRRSNRHRQ